MDKKIKLLAMTVITLGLSSCGDLFMKEKSDSGLSFNNALSCEADVKEFANIMKSDIEPTIRCLQDQLHTFIDLVKTDRPGYISEKVLIKFLKTGAIDLGDNDITPILKSIFDLTHVITGGQRGYVSRQNFDKLIEFLLKFNQNMIPVYREFSDDDINITYANYKLKKARVDIHLGSIARDLSTLLNRNRTTLDQIDINKFLDSFFAEDLLMAEKVKSLLFLKKVFLGGHDDYLTYIELDRALAKVSKLGIVAYDLMKLNSFKFTDEPITLVETYKSDVQLLKESVHYGPNDEEVLFSLQSVIDVLSIFEIKTFGIEIEKYLTEMRVLKGVLIGKNGGVNVHSSEFHRLINHLEFVVKQTYYFYRVYTRHQDVLESRAPLSIEFDKLPTTSDEEEYLNNFTRIVHNYKFFKGSNSTAVFNHEFHRNPGGIVEISIIEYFAKLIMKGYGEERKDARGGYHMTLDQTTDLVSDLRFLLKDLGIIKIGRRDINAEDNDPTTGKKPVDGEQSVIGAAENFVLMSTLFQYQSDGCNNDKVCMEIPEISEFLVGLVTAISIKDFFAEAMEAEDACNVPAGEAFPVSCFRKNFVKVMHKTITGDTRSIADYMPSFSKYLDDMRGTTDIDIDPSGSDDYNLFLGEMESFTRTCNAYSNGTSIDMSGSDAFGVFAGLLNLESTLLRFDTNGNGKLDGMKKKSNEVLTAYYDVYEGAIKSLVKKQISLGNLSDKLAKPIFKYLIKYGKVPEMQARSLWQFVKFLLKFNKRADASRTTIATILKTLGEQSDTAKDFPFDCDECIDNDCQDQAGPYWDRSVYDSEAERY